MKNSRTLHIWMARGILEVMALGLSYWSHTIHRLPRICVHFGRPTPHEKVVSHDKARPCRPRRRPVHQISSSQNSKGSSRQAPYQNHQSFFMTMSNPVSERFLADRSAPLCNLRVPEVFEQLRYASPLRIGDEAFAK
jgi:hypothetical protein